MKLFLPDTIHELEVISLTSPIYIDIYYVDRRKKTVFFEWDFGMSDSIHLEDYVLQDIRGLKNKITRSLKFDISHAFCHYQGDPNYTHYYWALYGNLKDRITVTSPEVS